MKIYTVIEVLEYDVPAENEGEALDFLVNNENRDVEWLVSVNDRFVAGVREEMP